MIEIDGNRGGGQVLRTALSLSMVTGKPFTMQNIRGMRPKPGLMRQHLTCVKAAAEISSASVEGAELRSQSLTFTPSEVRPGDYTFAIGSAGSTALVFQTLLPALAQCDVESKLTILGGTHNPMAPSATFIEKAFLPALNSYGVSAQATCKTVGFIPAGGGALIATIGGEPTSPPLPVETPLLHVLTTGLPEEVPKRIAKALAREFGEYELETEEANADCPGGCCHLFAGTAVVTGLAQRGTSSEKIAKTMAKEMKEYLESGAEVTAHLADQLMIYLALAGEGSFTTCRLTNHIRSNADTIAQFLSVGFKFNQETEGRVRVELTSS